MDSSYNILLLLSVAHLLLLLGRILMVQPVDPARIAAEIRGIVARISYMAQSVAHNLSS